MRRFQLALLCSFLLVLWGGLSGCRGSRGPQSVIRMADLHTEKQLLSGFYDLEAGAWRWTAQDFRVLLKVPTDAGQKGAYLTLQGTITEGGLQNGPVEVG